MKRNISLYLAFLAALTTSCVDFNDATGPVEGATIRLLKPAHFTDNSSLAGRTITLTAGTRTLTATTNAEGVATLSELPPDVYNISTSWQISTDDFLHYTAGHGQLQSLSGCTMAGNAANQLIDTPRAIDIQTICSANQDIIIGKIYYAGSRDDNNVIYDAGKYIELFNQSDNTIDVSGLYIGLGEAESTQAYTLDNLHEQHADSVVLLKQIFRIPADAPYPVEPGGTVVLTNSAIDHTANHASLESDLSHADFEAKDNSGRTTNNTEVPALKLEYSIYPTLSYMNLVNNGLNSIVIFYMDEQVSDLKTTYRYPNNDTRGYQWKLLPKRYILDGVECLPNKSTTGPDISAKRLYPDIDAGYININAVSGRTGEVVYRKTSQKRGANGHPVLEDTNNSTNDFQVSTTIKPRQYDE